jgi:hypothetical protein
MNENANIPAEGLVIHINGSSCRIRSDGPTWEGRTVGTIGEMNILDGETGRDLIAAAVRVLRAAGRDVVLAPMDGDTWHAYRAVVQTDGSARFPMEPWSGPHDVASLRECGFETVGRYASSRAPLPDDDADAPTVPGVRIVAWDGADAAGLLDRLYAMASTSFSEKSFYKDVSKDEFLALYSPLLGSIDPRLVLFALDATGTMVGFLFGYPDPSTGAAVLKTYAGAQRGVGRMLADRFHQDARRMGRTSVVHALMHEDNVSLERSASHDGTVFRRYELFARWHES